MQRQLALGLGIPYKRPVAFIPCPHSKGLSVAFLRPLQQSRTPRAAFFNHLNGHRNIPKNTTGSAGEHTEGAEGVLAAVNSSSSTSGSFLTDNADSSVTSIIGTTAKQLFQTAVHTLDQYEPREGTYEEDETPHSYALDSFEDRDAAAVAATYKASYEVLRLDETGKVRRLHMKRRDLLREHGLQPRDLRRIDPSVDFTKTSPSISIKEDVLLLNLGGIRAIVTAEKALLFEPGSANTRRLLDAIVPRLQAAAGHRLAAKQAAAAQQQHQQHQQQQEDGSGIYRRDYSPPSSRQPNSTKHLPFELEVLEGVLTVATGRLDTEVLNVTRRVGTVLTKLPREINPVNLEELRRIKQALVELENKADTLREMLEQIMDDEDELRELNLSSRPRREERRKQRERERMERALERAREEMNERRNSQDDASSSSSSSASPNGGPGGNGASPGGTTPQGLRLRFDGEGGPIGALGPVPWGMAPPGGMGYRTPFPGVGSNGYGGPALGGPQRGHKGGQAAFKDAKAARLERLAELYARHGKRKGQSDGREEREDSGEARERDSDRWRDRDDPEEDYQDAQDALEEMAEQEEEEQEVEEVEDLLEYYLQRASATQSEAERLLEGARDLEESIGVSLSARRYEVNRLELMLSMGSFAAAIGAMIAGIFGMNMRSTLEMSVLGFWGTTAGIVCLCLFVFACIMRYTQRKRIL